MKKYMINVENKWQTLERTLNMYAEDGWRVVSCVRDESEHEFVVIMERDE